MAWVSNVRASIGDDGATLSSPAPRFGILCLTSVASIVAVVVLERAFGTGPYVAILAIVLGTITAGLLREEVSASASIGWRAMQLAISFWTRTVATTRPSSTTASCDDECAGDGAQLEQTMPVLVGRSEPRGFARKDCSHIAHRHIARAFST